MIRILNFTEDNLLATLAENKLESDDYIIIRNEFQKIIAKNKKVNWYFEMKDFKGWQPKALWEDLKLDIDHSKDLHKVAMVGDEKWEKWMTQIMKPFVKAEYFDISEKEKALEWLRN
ncbi:MAG: STAS/SEC14 domain-containing protein [Gillisia sp.]